MVGRTLGFAVAGLVAGAVAGWWFDQLFVEAGLGVIAGALLSGVRARP